jgi:hypothetical protein
MGHGIADGVELTPLPGDSAERRGSSRLKAGMVITDDELTPRIA